MYIYIYIYTRKLPSSDETDGIIDWAAEERDALPDARAEIAMLKDGDAPVALRGDGAGTFIVEERHPCLQTLCRSEEGLRGLSQNKDFWELSRREHKNTKLGIWGGAKVSGRVGFDPLQRNPLTPFSQSCIVCGEACAVHVASGAVY